MWYSLKDRDGILASCGYLVSSVNRVRYNPTYNEIALTSTLPYSEDLISIANTFFDTNPWYDDDDNPLSVSLQDGVFDYENKHIWFRKVKDGIVVADVVYSTPQDASSIEAIKRYFGTEFLPEGIGNWEIGLDFVVS